MKSICETCPHYATGQDKGQTILCNHGKPQRRWLEASSKTTGCPLGKWPGQSETSTIMQRVNNAFTGAVAKRKASYAALHKGEWPPEVRKLAALRKDGDVGVGDTLKRYLAERGAESIVTWFHRLTGFDCGCDDRAKALNMIYPYT